MPEMTHAGEYHGHAVFIGRGNHFLVTHRAARLNYRRDACLMGGIDTIAEGEEGIGGHDRALDFQFFIGSLDAGDFGRIYPRHLALSTFSRDRNHPRLPDVYPNNGIQYQDVLDEVARDMLVNALRQAKGNKSRAARFLNIPRHVLLYQMEKLKVPEYN